MRKFGKIKSYDDGCGTGSITPENGEEALCFRKSDLKRASRAPRWGERFGYEVEKSSNGKSRAINLIAQPRASEIHQEQARAQRG